MWWIHRARPRRPDDGGEAGGAAGAASAAGAAGAGSPPAGEAGKGAAGDAAAGAGAGAGAGKGGAENTPAAWPANWRETLAGDDEKTLKQLQRYASPAEVWKKAKGLEERVSSGELRTALSAKPTAEELTAWRKTNGVPEKADGYDLGPASSKFPEETKVFLDKVLPKLHDANLNNDQAKLVLKTLNDHVLDQRAVRAEADIAAQEAGEEELRSEWGNEFKRNISVIHNMLAGAVDGEFKDVVLHARGEDGVPLSSNPKWLKFLLNLGLIDNPAAKLVPNSGNDPMKGLNERIAEIEGKMHTKTYINDEKMQAEYRELIDTRDKLAARSRA